MVDILIRSFDEDLVFVTSLVCPNLLNQIVCTQDLEGSHNFTSKLTIYDPIWATFKQGHIVTYISNGFKNKLFICFLCPLVFVSI